MTKYFKYEKTYKKGNKIVNSILPCIWEQGGFKNTSNEGYSLIVGDKFGKPKEPVFVKFTGSLCNGKHGLFNVNLGDVLAETVAKNEESFTALFKVISFDNENDSLIVEVIDDISPFLDIYRASKDKASIVKCKNLVYYLKTEKIEKLEKSMQLKNERKQNSKMSFFLN